MPNETASQNWWYSPGFFLALAIFVLTVSLLLDHYQQVVWHDTSAKVLAGLSMLIGMAGIVVSQSEADDRRDAFLRVTLDLLMAIVIGLAFTRTLATTVDLAQSVVHATSLGLIILMLSIVTRTVRQHDKFKKSTKSIEAAAERIAGATDRVERFSLQVDYARLAADALQLHDKDEFVDAYDNTRLNRGLIDAVTAGVWTTRAWVRKRTDLPEAARGLWQRVMTMYHQEETFGLAQCYFPTTVRNFAFLLLGMIDELKEEKSDSQNVVILNCTNFPPKDFYNFPAGHKDKRFYHEPQFFGSYRRALAQIVQESEILPLRIFLCTDEEDKPALESSNKLIAFGQALRIWPAPFKYSSGQIAEDLREYLEGAYLFNDFLTKEPFPGPTPAGEKLLFRVPTWHDLTAGKNHLRYLGKAHDTEESLRFAQENRQALGDVLEKWTNQNEVRNWQVLLEKFGRAENLLRDDEVAKATDVQKRLEAVKSGQTGQSVRQAFRLVQELDMFLQVAGVGEDCESGLPEAERWLYWRLLQLEQASIASAGLDMPASSWRIFCKQALALAPSAPELSTCVRFAHLDDISDIAALGVKSEFLLLGLADKEVQEPAGVNWIGLIGAEITEPFKTCRVLLKLNPGDPQFKSHTDWVIKMWSQSEARTEQVVGELSSAG